MRWQSGKGGMMVRWQVAKDGRVREVGKVGREVRWQGGKGRGER